jgi:MFS family permease
MATVLKSLAIWSLYSPTCKFACHKENVLIYFISYASAISSTIKTRISNSYLIGEIFGMLFFGWIIDRLGRRTGNIFTTLFLILGIALAIAAHGKDKLGLFWMMIVAREIIAGFGAGGEYPTCGTNSAEASDESIYVRRRRGILVAISTDFAIHLGFVVAGVVALIELACYNQNIVDGVWRVYFGLGIVGSIICGYNTSRTTAYIASFLLRYSSFEFAWWMPHNTASMPSSPTFHMSSR